MGSTQMYSLSWGDYGSSLASTVQVLRGHGELIDVTLAAGGRIFPAHKLVLSAASPLLMELLKSTGCQHPVVMLAGVAAHDLEALLQFVYNGEVSVDPNQLPSLLQAAHCLDIQALSPNIIASEKMMCQSMTVGSDDGLSRDQNSLLPVRKRKRKQRRTSENGLPNKWPLMESIGTDNINHMSSTAQLTHSKEESASCTDDNSTSSKRLVSDQPVECSICGVVLKQSRNLRRHMALIHLKVAGGKTKTIKKQVDKIKKEGVVDANSETENSISSNGTNIFRPIPSAPLPFNSVGLLPSPLYQQPFPTSTPLREMAVMPQSQPESLPHQSTPPSLALQPREQTQPPQTDLSEPSTSTSLCDTMNNPTFVPTTMHFNNDNLFRQHPNELMRNANLYNVADTREQCAND